MDDHPPEMPGFRRTRLDALGRDPLLPPPASLGEALPREMARVVREVLPHFVVGGAPTGIPLGLCAVLAIACDAVAEQDIPRMVACLGALRQWSAPVAEALAAAAAAPRERRPAPRPAFTCPDCGRTSHNPNDAREGYCGACHTFPEDRAARQPRRFTEAFGEPPFKTRRPIPPTEEQA